MPSPKSAKGGMLLNHHETIDHGEDNLGKFFVERNRGCPHCRKQNVTAIRYTVKPKVPEYVAEAPSFILKSRNIGLTCGCYAAMQRQIVHINGGKKK